MISTISLYSRLASLPSPDVRSTIITTFMYHMCSHPDIFCSMVSTHSTWETVVSDCLKKEVQNSGRPVVRAASNSRDETGFSVNKAVYHEFISDEF
jgi:hypothetical protein